MFLLLPPMSVTECWPMMSPELHEISRTLTEKHANHANMANQANVAEFVPRKVDATKELRENQELI
jgi:hypothetical protein